MSDPITTPESDDMPQAEVVNDDAAADLELDNDADLDTEDDDNEDDEVYGYEYVPVTFAQYKAKMQKSFDAMEADGHAVRASRHRIIFAMGEIAHTLKGKQGLSTSEQVRRLTKVGALAATIADEAAKAEATISDRTAKAEADAQGAQDAVATASEPTDAEVTDQQV